MDTPTITLDVKLCKDCAHCFTWRQRSFVDGTESSIPHQCDNHWYDDHSQPYSCQFARAFGACGPSAKNFKAKEETK